MPITWRFITECMTCHEVIDLGPAPTPAEEQPTTHRGVDLECPHCGAAHTYPAGRVQRGLVDAPDA